MNRIKTYIFLSGSSLIYFTVTGGFTWQLVPLTFALATCVLFAKFKNLNSKWVYFILPFGIITTLASLYAFPRFKLPDPTGKYAIGVTYATLHTDRDEIFTQDPNDTRVLYCKIWYPAVATPSSIKNPYLEGGSKAIEKLADLAELPSFLLSHFQSIRTHSLSDAPIASGKFPLLTFSHGYGSWFGQNTALMEELASQGFIVLALTHSYQSIISAVDEKNLVYFEKVVPLDTPEDSIKEEKIFEQFLETEDTLVFSQLFYKQLQEASSFTHTCVRIWAEDISSALDFMINENSQNQSHFYAHIDLSKIGALGMSFGGAASGEAAIRDHKIKAGINMDGTQYGIWSSDTMNVPMMMLEAKRSPFGYSMYAPLKKRSKSQYINLLFLETKHYNFTDVSIYSPIFRWLGVTGSIQGKTMIKEMNFIVSDFFHRAFNGESIDEKPYLKPGIIEQSSY